MAMDWNKIKGQLVDLADQLKESALDLIDDFKRQSKYFQWRAGVVAGYVLLVVLTFAVAPPPGESNPIDVQVEAASIPWGVSNKTIIELVNQSGDDYDGLMVVVEGANVNDEDGAQTPGTWSYSRTKLREGETLQLEAKHFINDAGEGPTLGFIPKAVEVRCADGVYRKDSLKVRRLR